MISTYKKLGPYIRRVDERNTNGSEDNLLGVSTQKVFIKSIANTVGTNFKKYKVVRREQFVYIPDTSRRGDKIGLAMLDHLDQGLVSQAYTVFEVIDHEVLDPEYLMMWFRRPEFDRYARFKSHGSVREIFGWDEMCDVDLPVPDIIEQRRIVSEYKAVTNRIKLNKRLIKKLEDTAQAIYKQWFIDFEFPMPQQYAESVGKPELAGCPYKTSGGEFVTGIDGEPVPAFWNSAVIADLAEVASGKSAKNKVAIPSKDNPYPVLGAGGIAGYSSEFLYSEKLLVMGRVGTHGVIRRINEKCWPSDNTLVLRSNFSGYVSQLLSNINYDEINRGGVQALITQTDIKSIFALLPDRDTLEAYEAISDTVFAYASSMEHLLSRLDDLTAAIQGRMSRVEFAV